MEKIRENNGRQRGRLRVAMARLVTAVLAIGFLAAYYRYWVYDPVGTVYTQSVDLPRVDNISKNFRLRHILHHGVGSPTHKRLDITEDYLDKHRDNFIIEDMPNIYKGKNPFSLSLPVKRQYNQNPSLRLKNNNLEFMRSFLQIPLNMVKNNLLEWEQRNISVPNVNDKSTLVSMALMSSNAYVRFPIKDDKTDWRDVIGWKPDDTHNDLNFGWDETGLRGHVFLSDDDLTVVISIKGTSGAGLPGGGSDETAANDKTNDNLLFSCCCARVGYMWTTVCDCYDSTYTCNQDCLEKELIRKDRYYNAVLELYDNVTKIYPPEKYNYWLTGHSLGGALASLLGRTYGIPVVAFEAPGEYLATKRLHLPQPPGLPKHLENIWHIGNTADPIYMGVCNGVSSSCSIGGYAMETACHTGLQCVYDVVNDLGWKVNLLNHRIHTVIDEIINVYNSTPTCIEQPPCRDCFNWRFISKHDKEKDEPWLPNPLDPHRSTSISSTSTNSPTGSSQPSPIPDEPTKKCLERNWYGWCTKWGTDDDEDEE